MIDHAEDIERLLENARSHPMTVDADLARETGRRRVHSRRMTIAGATLALIVVGGTAAVQLAGPTSDHLSTPAHSTKTLAHSTSSAPAPTYSAISGSIFQRGAAMKSLPYNRVVLPGTASNAYDIDGTLRHITITARRDGRKIPLHITGPLAGGIFTARDGSKQIVAFPVPANTPGAQIVLAGSPSTDPQLEVDRGVPLASGGQVAVGTAPAGSTIVGAWWDNRGTFGATRGVAGSAEAHGMTAFVFPGLHTWGLASEMGMGWQTALTSPLDTGGGDGGGLPRVYARLLPSAASLIKVTTNPSVRDARVTVKKVAGTSYQLVLVTSATTRMTTKLVTAVSWLDAEGRTQRAVTPPR